MKGPERCFSRNPWLHLFNARFVRGRHTKDGTKNTRTKKFWSARVSQHTMTKKHSDHQACVRNRIDFGGNHDINAWKSRRQQIDHQRVTAGDCPSPIIHSQLIDQDENYYTYTLIHFSIRQRHMGQATSFDSHNLHAHMCLHDINTISTSSSMQTPSRTGFE